MSVLKTIGLGGETMFVLAIEKLERGKYKIITDEDINILLYYKEYKALEFEENKEVSTENWEKALQIITTRGKKRVYHLLGRQDYTRNDIRKKLHKDGHPSAIIDDIIFYFEDKGFIDDMNYVRKYYAYHKNSKSKRVIEMKLREKGVEREILKEFFVEIDVTVIENETAKKLLNKKYGRKDVIGDDRVKMVQFLAYKGFDYDVAKRTVTEFFDNMST